MREPRFIPTLRRYRVTAPMFGRPDWTGIVNTSDPILEIKRMFADWFSTSPDRIGLERAE